MSQRLERELSKLKDVTIDKTKLGYRIHKQEKIRLVENNCYIIKLGSSIYNKDSVLASNWNNGRVPSGIYYQVEINKIMGNMIRITGIGYSDPQCTNFVDNWFGWLPINDIEVLSKL